MVLPASERPDRLRTILLAYPKHITKKYVAPVYTGKTYTGVRPGAVRGKPKKKWRLNQLAIPRWKVSKYVFVEDNTGISPSILNVTASQRTNDISRSTLRYLYPARTAYSSISPKIKKNLQKAINLSWKTIYNYYRKQTIDNNRKKEMRLSKQRESSTKTKPKTPKELQDEKEKRIAEWCAVRAQPKRSFPPEPVQKRPAPNLAEIIDHANILAEPRSVTRKFIRPSIDPTYIDPTRVTPAAQTYVASERVLELAKNPAYRLIKVRPIIPGAVKKSALTCTVSPRFDELAVPKKKAAEKDSDLKENPFQISPNALKAKPSPRIEELAKPIER